MQDQLLVLGVIAGIFVIAYIIYRSFNNEK